MVSFGQTDFQIAPRKNVTLDVNNIRSVLSPLRNSPENVSRTINLTLSDGVIHQFETFWSPILSPELQAQYPEITTYQLRDVNDPTITGRMSLTPSGLEAFIIKNGETMLIQPDEENTGRYKVSSSRASIMEGFECGQNAEASSLISPFQNLGDLQDISHAVISNGSSKRTYRLGLIGTGEFYNANGGTATAAMTAMTNSVNAISAIFQRELAVFFTINQSRIFTNPATDPFTPDTQMGANNRTTQAADAIKAEFMDADYDIGHVFHTHDALPSTNPMDDDWTTGGVAGLGVVCDNTASGAGLNKGRGWSGSFDNTSLGWHLLAAHEFGHMFDATHTFNGTGSSCTGAISNTSAYEIASGTTIMSYRGICSGTQNIPESATNGSYFHHFSLAQMLSYIGTQTCQATAPIANTPPTANANPGGGTLVIPRGTPFTLTGSGSDANSDVITYCWEQLDEDGAGAPTQGFIGAMAANSNIAPLFRSFPPNGNPERTFPQLSNILAGNNNGLNYEALPMVGRTLNFVLTVRDNNALGNGLASSEVQVMVDPNTGPFEVTSQNGATTWAGGSNQTITWDVAGTTGGQTNCANVKILMSVDGGNSFPYVLAASAPNNGSANITVPDIQTTTARVKVMCADGIFFDINNVNIEITSNCMAQSSCILPSAAMTLPVGDPGLNLGLNNLIGQSGTGRTLNWTNASATQNAAMRPMEMNTTTCFESGFSMKVESFTFSVKVSGAYTSSITTTNFAIQTFFQTGSFNPAMPCNSTWVGSNGWDQDGVPGGSVSSGGALTMNLTAGQTYTAVAYSPDNGSITFNITGPDNIVLLEPLNTNYAYTYLAVNKANNNIAAVSATSNFTSLPAGMYKIYGLTYKSGGPTPPNNVNPSTYVNQPLTNLINGTNCALLSANCKDLTVEDTNACSITVITVANISACNDNGTPSTADDTYTADVTVTFANAPATGTLDLSGDGTSSVAVGALGSPTSHTFTNVTMPADGGAIALTATFSADNACTFTNNNAGTAPAPCSTQPCAITAITVANISACNDNGTPSTADDTYTADVTVTFANAPATGTLDLTGDGTDMVAVGALGSPTSHTFTNVTMPADGGAIALTATFSADNACTFTNNNAATAPSPCSTQPCAITAITVANISACNDNGTPSTADDTYTADVTVTFANAPGTGTLDLTGDGTSSVAVGALGSPTSHTFTSVSMPADGGAIALTATFSADNACTFTNNNAGTAPGPCSVQPCAITEILVANISACDDNGTPSTADDTFTADVTVIFSNAPATGTLDLTGDGTAMVAVGALDAATNHTFTGVEMPADGGPISLTATFSDDMNCTYTEDDLGTAPDPCSTQPVCEITSITVTFMTACNDQGTPDPADDTFLANVQVLWSNPPATGTIVLSGDGSSSVPIPAGPGVTIGGVEMSADGGPISLTATFSDDMACTFTNDNAGTAPAPCSVQPPCAITEMLVANISACDDNGTPSTADDTFTADVTVIFSSAPATGTLDLTGDGTAMVAVGALDAATNHTFTGVEMPADGGPISLTATFSDDMNCTYTEDDLGTAPDPCSTQPVCEITSILVTFMTDCDDKGTPDPADDTFLANVQVLWSNPPATGTIVLSGDGSSSVPIPAGPGVTIGGVEMSADGGPISLTATFSDDMACTFTNDNAGTAPAPCSVQPPCAITEMLVANISACDDNGTPSTADDTFTADVTVIFSSAPATGTLDLTGDGTAMVAVGALDAATNHTFTDVEMPADGGPIALTASFSDDMNCTYTEDDLGTAPTPCSAPQPCNISGITVGPTIPGAPLVGGRMMAGPVCNGDGTYNVELCIQWQGNPLPPFIEVEINGNGQFIQIPIDGPQDQPEKCFVLENLPANGRLVTIFARIGREGCTYRARDLFRAPDRCDPPPTTCDITGANVQIAPTCDNGTVSTCIMIEGVNLPADASNARAFVGGQPVEITQYTLVTGGAVVCFQGLRADGGTKDFFFQAERGCSITKRSFLRMPRSCDGDPGDDDDDDCDITGMRNPVVNCDGNGTYNLTFEVTYNDMPAGQLAVEVGHGANKTWTYHAVTGSPQTITVAGLPAVGGYANVFVKSNNVRGCTWYERSWYRAPDNCGRNRNGEFETKLDQIRVYPNPSAGQFFVLIEQETTEMIEVAVSNSLGQVVKTLQVESNREEVLDLNGMPEGIYTLRILQGEAPVYRQVQVQR